MDKKDLVNKSPSIVIMPTVPATKPGSATWTKKDYDSIIKFRRDLLKKIFGRNKKKDFNN